MLRGWLWWKAAATPSNWNVSVGGTEISMLFRYKDALPALVKVRDLRSAAASGASATYTVSLLRVNPGGATSNAVTPKESPSSATFWYCCTETPDGKPNTGSYATSSL